MALVVLSPLVVGRSRPQSGSPVRRCRGRPGRCLAGRCRGRTRRARAGHRGRAGRQAGCRHHGRPAGRRCPSCRSGRRSVAAFDKSLAGPPNSPSLPDPPETMSSAIWPVAKSLPAPASIRSRPPSPPILVVAVPATDKVVAARHVHPGRIAEQEALPGVAQDRVVAGAAVELVVAQAPTDGVVTAQANDEVVAVQPGDHVPTGGAAQDIRAVGAHDGGGFLGEGHHVQAGNAAWAWAAAGAAISPAPVRSRRGRRSWSVVCP